MLSYFAKKKKDSKPHAAPPTSNKPSVPSSSTAAQLADDNVPLPPSSDALILDPRDEAFFQDLASDIELPPQLPPRPVGRSIISEDGEELEPDSEALTTPPESSASGANTPRKNPRSYLHYWHYIPAVYITERVIEQVPTIKRKLSSRAASPSRDKKQPNPASASQSADGKLQATTHVEGQQIASVDEKEVAKEKRDLSELLGNLNLTVTTQVAKLSKESQKLLEDFSQVLKDIVNGVPTAYDDLESLLTNKEKELNNLYEKLPPYLQTLVKSLPTKMYQYIAPQLAAAAAAAAENDKRSGTGSGKKRSKTYIPSLKDLLIERGTVIAMLRSILSFLRMRFPALLGSTNVLVSLAVFLLLFVFWYCHKRGREVRLEREATERGTDARVEEEIDEATAEAARGERQGRD